MKLLNRKQIVSAICAFGADRTVFISGEKGIGKTQILHDLQDDPRFADYIFTAPKDLTQMGDGSLWMPCIDMEKGVSRELPNEELGLCKGNQRGVKGARPIIIMLDEVGKAPRHVLNNVASLVHEHRIGSYYLPEGSITICCTNLTHEGLGDSVQAHFGDRLVHMFMRKPTLQEWVNEFAIPNGLNAEVITACHQNPAVFDSFLDYEADGKYAGQDMSKHNHYVTNPRITQIKCATPRSIHAASDIVRKQNMMDEETLEAGLEGSVGEAFAKDIMATIRFGKQMPDYDHVIASPETCMVPEDATVQIIQTFQFVTRSERKDVTPLIKYVKRMRQELQGLFCTTIANNSQKAAMFAVSKDFGAMLAGTRNLF